MLMESFNHEDGQLWRSLSVGGGGGQPFSDIHWPPQASDRLLAQSAKPVEVRVRVGRYVDQVQMWWDTGELLSHGGDGSEQTSFVLNAGETIANVRLTGERYVGSIELITNQGRSISLWSTDRRDY